MLAALAGAAPAAHAAGGTCFFRAKGTATLAFGTIDPSSTGTVNAAITNNSFSQVGDCTSGVMLVFADNGAYASGGSRRMSNAAKTDFIPYTLTVPTFGAGPGNGRYVSWPITGTIAPAAFQNASAGMYSDTVVLTVIP